MNLIEILSQCSFADLLFLEEYFRFINAIDINYCEGNTSQLKNVIVIINQVRQIGFDNLGCQVNLNIENQLIQQNLKDINLKSFNSIIANFIINCYSLQKYNLDYIFI